MLAAIGEPGPASIVIEDDPSLREVIAEQLRAPGDVELVAANCFDPARPRLRASPP